MKKLLAGTCTASLPFLLGGCGRTENGEISLSTIYGAAALLSLLLLIGYCCIDRKRNRWFLLLFSSVLVVNVGYFALSVSHDLEDALMNNRLSYLGSVFLPLSILMIILQVTEIRYRRWLPPLLFAIAAVMFLIAASPGYLDIYYRDVGFVIIDGVSTLKKVYGPWHFLYALYLVCYFTAMVAVIIHASVKKKLSCTCHAVILAIAVLANLGVWLAGQLTDLKFEFLSISYIISELFLLGLHLMVAENRRLKELVTKTEPLAGEASPSALTNQLTVSDPTAADRLQKFADGLAELTQTERAIFDAYVARITTKEIMSSRNITENTLKFHNKNLYQKLGVSSRKELLETYALLTRGSACDSSQEPV